MKKLILALAIILAFVSGFIVGRQYTIRTAELLESNDTEYHISFGDEVHSYTFDEDNLVPIKDTQRNLVPIKDKEMK